MSRLVILLVSAAFLAALAAAPAAQPRSGDVIAVTARQVLDVVPGGAVTTLAALPAGQTGLGVCASFSNGGVALLTRHATTTADTVYVLDLQNGQLRTVGSFQGPGGPVVLVTQGGIVRDQRGDYVTASPLGVFRFAGVGGAVKKVVSTVGTGIAEHLGAGGWLTFVGGQILHVTRAGQTSKLGGFPGPVVFGFGGLFADTTTGDAFVPYTALYHFSLATARFTTLASGSPFGSIRCGDVDPRDRSLVLGTGSGVYRVDRQGRLLGTLALVGSGVVGVAVFGSNHVLAVGPSTPGTAWSVRVSFPADAGRFYQLGASLGFAPGIPTASGTVPLDPDPLLFLSFVAPTVFQNFGGRLDGSGTASAALAIPAVPALKGLRLYLAGLTYDSLGGILTISEPEGLTVE